MPEQLLWSPIIFHVMKVKKLYQEWHQTENNLKGKKVKCSFNSKIQYKMAFLPPWGLTSRSWWVASGDSSAGSACLAAAMHGGSCPASCRDWTSCCSDSAWTCAENTDSSVLQNGLAIVTTDLFLKIWQIKVWNRLLRVSFSCIKPFWYFHRFTGSN